MKCLIKYKWIKLPRDIEIEAKGLLTYYIRLVTRAAFRKGMSHYCGFENPVEPGMWSGGIVGVKSILGVKKRLVAFWIMNQLEDLGYLTWTLEPKTKLLTYKITDWVTKCSGAPCEEGAVYASTCYGFIGMPRDITQRLVDQGYKFEPGDAFPRFERTGDYLYYAVFPESILSPMNAAMVTKVSTKRYHGYSPAERYCAKNPNRAGISRIPV